MVYDVYDGGNDWDGYWRFVRSGGHFRPMSLSRKIGTRIDDPGDKRAYVRGLFAGIADRYDLTNDVMSFGMHRRWKDRTLELVEIGPGQRILDLAGGTGDLARQALAMAGGDAEVVVADLTPEMLRVGSSRSGPSPAGWVAGDAAALPFPDESFDRVLIGYGLRNFADLSGCLREILRCLKPGGRLASLDFGKPPSKLVRGAYLTYLEGSTRLVGWAMHRDAESYVYIPESLRRFPGQRGVVEAMEEAGYVDCRSVDLLLGTMGINLGERPG